MARTPEKLGYGNCKQLPRWRLRPQGVIRKVMIRGGFTFSFHPGSFDIFVADTQMLDDSELLNSNYLLNLSYGFRPVDSLTWFQGAPPLQSFVGDALCLVSPVGGRARYFDKSVTRSIFNRSVTKNRRQVGLEGEICSVRNKKGLLDRALISTGGETSLKSVERVIQKHFKVKINQHDLAVLQSSCRPCDCLFQPHPT